MSRRTSRLASAAGITAAALLLTGCFSIESTFEVHDDATADVTYRVLIDTEQLDQFSGLLGDEADGLGDLSGEALLDEMMGGDDPCGDLEGDLSGYDVTTTEINEGGKVGLECTAHNVSLDELNDSMDSDDGAAFLIEQDDTGTRFTATLEGVDELADPGMGDMGEMGEMLDLGFEDMFSIVFNVSAPGTLGANNATSTNGSTASWDITPDADFVTGGDATMRAEWTPGDSGSSGSSALWIILGILAALVVIGLIIFLVKRNKSNGGGDGTSGAPLTVPPTMASTPPPPPGTTAPMAPPAAPPPSPSATDVPPPAPPMAPPPLPPT